MVGVCVAYIQLFWAVVYTSQDEASAPAGGHAEGRSSPRSFFYPPPTFCVPFVLFAFHVFMFFLGERRV